MVEKRRALVIPAICPVEHSIMESTANIAYYDVYFEDKHLALFEPRLTIGSFAILRESFEGYSIAFLHPYEVFNILSAKLVVFSYRNIDILRPRDIARLVKSGKELNDFLARKWYEGNLIVVSNYVAEALIDNLSIKCKRGYEKECYCYGRIRRVINKIDINSLVSMGRLLARPPESLNAHEKAEVVFNCLLHHSTHWPWMNFGLIVDKSRKWVTMLNPDIAWLVNVDDVEEVRVIDYVPQTGWEGNYVPLIIVKKLNLKPLSVRISQDLSSLISGDVEAVKKNLSELLYDIAMKLRRPSIPILGDDIEV